MKELNRQQARELKADFLELVTPEALEQLAGGVALTNINDDPISFGIVLNLINSEETPEAVTEVIDQIPESLRENIVTKSVDEPRAL